MASATAASDITDGPVLSLINKRIRNLRKKLNRIAQLEESIAHGKSVKNKEQEELLKSKPSIVSAVDELEKFRQPLSVAVDEEINLAIKHRQVGASENNDKEVDVDTTTKTLEKEENEATAPVELVEDLLSLIYFGSMFDVKSQSDFNSIMLTRTHERNCCLTYDYVTDDDAAVMLAERDLDLISLMSSLLISRPVDSSFSHQNALQRCIEHAKLWLEKSEQPIDSNNNITYADLREKLAKIIGSDYLNITPEMKATADVAAEAAGNYTFQVPVQVETSVAPHEQKEDDATDFQRNETYEGQSSPVDDHPKDEIEPENNLETPPVETNAAAAGGTKDQNAPRRSYNQRGGGGGRYGGNGGGRSGGRGYSNGRGGRSGGRGGPYQNQFNEQQGNYYQRNYHGGGGGGRGGRGNSNGGSYGYNHRASGGVEVAEF